MVETTQALPTPVSQISLSTPEDWRIKVRVLAKSPIKTHARGRLFKVDFVDCEEKVTIEACFYTEETDLWYDKIEEGATYLVSKAEIAPANKRMTSIPHDFRLIFKTHTLVEKVEDQTP